MDLDSFPVSLYVPVDDRWREEPGNLFYQAHRDPENPNLFFLYEQYVDEDSYKAHGDSEHFEEYAPRCQRAVGRP